MARPRHKPLLNPDAARAGTALRAMREAAQLNQRQLAERLGVSQRWVYAREQGKARVEVADFIAWCRACGVAPSLGFERLLKALAE